MSRPNPSSGRDRQPLPEATAGQPPHWWLRFADDRDAPDAEAGGCAPDPEDLDGWYAVRREGDRWVARHRGREVLAKDSPAELLQALGEAR